MEDIVPRIDPVTTSPDSCEPSLTTSNVANICKGKVIFNEDFISPIDNHPQWTIEQRYADAPVSI